MVGKVWLASFGDVDTPGMKVGERKQAVWFSHWQNSISPGLGFADPDYSPTLQTPMFLVGKGMMTALQKCSPSQPSRLKRMCRCWLTCITKS